jgi:hypothetical protein
MPDRAQNKVHQELLLAPAEVYFKLKQLVPVHATDRQQHKERKPAEKLA